MDRRDLFTPFTRARMTFKLAALSALWFFSAGLFAAGAAETGAPNPVTVTGTTEKVCQLTGEIDWETGQPTAAQTLTNFGLGATDLGYPVEHRGKLILLFGDSWPPPRPPGVAPIVPPNDAVGIIVQREPPDKDGCLELTINDRFNEPWRFAPARIDSEAAIKQGSFNVPSGGVGGTDGLYAFFWTDHCAKPAHLRPSPYNPLARPAPSIKCPETDDRNSIGRAVLARSQDDGRTFHNVMPMPIGFIYSTASSTALLDGLPEDQRLGIFIFGVPRYRASIPYLAYARAEAIANPSTWYFFTGRGPDGHPAWVPYASWTEGGSTSGSKKAQAWKPAGNPEIFDPAEPSERCIGEFSVTWNSPLGSWLLLYQCRNRVWARIARAPWGPWSSATPILDAGSLRCRLLMSSEGCGDRRNFWPLKNGEFMPGGLYAPFVLNRYTRAAEGPGRRSTIYWLVSTWNPYEVVVMRTTLQSGMP